VFFLYHILFYFVLPCVYQIIIIIVVILSNTNNNNMLFIVCIIFCEQVSWAPGIGIKKSAFKKLFDEDRGVTYIPWTKLPSSMESLVEGGLIDEDSLPPPAATTGNCYFSIHEPVIYSVVFVLHHKG